MMLLNCDASRCYFLRASINRYVYSVVAFTMQSDNTELKVIRSLRIPIDHVRRGIGQGEKLDENATYVS